jgi:hypothetical protein
LCVGDRYKADQRIGDKTTGKSDGGIELVNVHSRLILVPCDCEKKELIGDDGISGILLGWTQECRRSDTV